jgi:Domain of unknown function (DUF5615)
VNRRSTSGALITAELEGVLDPEVLHRCTEHGRILVSHDENSMPGHFRDFLAAGHRSPGVLIVPQDAAIGAAIESILLVWIASESEEWRNRLVWLPL